MRKCCSIVPGLVLCATMIGCFAPPSFDNEPFLNCETIIEEGVIILNEGTFGNNEGRLDFVYNDSDSIICAGIFERINGKPLGDVAQEGVFVNGKLYVIVNNSHLLYELNESTLSLERTLPLPAGLRSSPRSIKGYTADALYVSSLLDSSVFVIEASSLQIRKRIHVGNFPEGVAVTKQYVFVALGNYVGENNAGVAVIDRERDSLLSIISLPLTNPGQLAIQGDMLWVACRGDFFTQNPQAGLVGINALDLSIDATIPLQGNLQNELQIAGNTAYVLRDSSIAWIDLEREEVLADWKIRTDFTTNRWVYPYSLSLDAQAGLLYVGLAHGLGANGEVVSVDPFGQIQRRIPAGRFPGQVIFR
ncbi:MAG: YncE family protein [Bacteroidia bacterium]